MAARCSSVQRFLAEGIRKVFLIEKKGHNETAIAAKYPATEGTD